MTGLTCSSTAAVVAPMIAAAMIMTSSPVLAFHGAVNVGAYLLVITISMASGWGPSGSAVQNSAGLTVSRASDSVVVVTFHPGGTLTHNALPETLSATVCCGPSANEKAHVLNCHESGENSVTEASAAAGGSDDEWMVTFRTVCSRTGVEDVDASAEEVDDPSDSVAVPGFCVVVVSEVVGPAGSGPGVAGPAYAATPTMTVPTTATTANEVTNAKMGIKYALRHQGGSAARPGAWFPDGCTAVSHVSSPSELPGVAIVGLHRCRKALTRPLRPPPPPR